MSKLAKNSVTYFMDGPLGGWMPLFSGGATFILYLLEDCYFFRSTTLGALLISWLFKKIFSGTIRYNDDCFQTSASGWNTWATRSRPPTWRSTLDSAAWQTAPGPSFPLSQQTARTTTPATRAHQHFEGHRRT